MVGGVCMDGGVLGRAFCPGIPMLKSVPMNGGGMNRLVEGGLLFVLTGSFLLASCLLLV